MTEAERRLWFHLRGHRFVGCKFRRQQPLGPYIADFVAIAHRLVIEVDGSQHLDSDADTERDRWLAAEGFRVVRFWNHQVLQDTEAVLMRILVEIDAHAALAQCRDNRTNAGEPTR